MSFIICVPVKPAAPGTIVADLNKKRECFVFPDLVVEFPQIGPDPFFRRVAKALRGVFGPQPEPWSPSALAKSSLSEDTIRDVRLLATINALSDKLSPALRGMLASSLRSATSQLAVPEGSEVTIAA